ncbi:MAG: alpha/beta hydrolase [Ilumatobacteraceae bacterium]
MTGFGARATGLFAAGACSAAAWWTVAHSRSTSGLGWAASECAPRPFGRLWARSAGGGDDAVVLLHGLISTGDVFGAVFDRLAWTHHLVVPDLLGFGRSMDEARESFDVEEHLDALDELAERTGLFDSARWTLGAHSMGVSLALRWAARHPDRSVRVVGFGAPVYRSPEQARRHIAVSAMARLFAFDTALAERACALSCRHRAAAGWLSVVAEPRLPIPIARAASMHTWPAYRDAVRHLVLDVDWAAALRACDEHGIEVDLVWGGNDRIGDRAFAGQLIDAGRLSRLVVLEEGDHRLPLTHPTTCVEQLLSPHRPLHRTALRSGRAKRRYLVVPTRAAAAECDEHS